MAPRIVSIAQVISAISLLKPVTESPSTSTNALHRQQSSYTTSGHSLGTTFAAVRREAVVMLRA